MDIKIERNDKELNVALDGRLDTLSAPELEDRIETELDDTERLIFDMSGLRYISSAGLRVLLSSMKAMEDQGSMTVRNVSSEVMDIFEVTGFADMLDIE
ncbi:MAG: STAS domain-containing protein [Oscillospiraceae bacterium]|nr:STAS domain-containing protein [Oscillospiraceae bacterium]